MKKPASKKKKKRSGRKRSQEEPQSQAQAAVDLEASGSSPEAAERVEAKKPVAVQAARRDAEKRPEKKPEKKKEDRKSIGDYFSIAVQFLREARVELKKVKWPTRKELLASTAMVIFLVLIAALYLGLIDFGLIKIIRSVVG